ncbi:MAG: hypothetical protein RL070_1114, partial [Bacteroidota bacterium]
ACITFNIKNKLILHIINILGIQKNKYEKVKIFY